jgi:hypothetical protein
MGTSAIAHVSWHPLQPDLPIRLLSGSSSLISPGHNFTIVKIKDDIKNVIQKLANVLFTNVALK